MLYPENSWSGVQKLSRIHHYKPLAPSTDGVTPRIVWEELLRLGKRDIEMQMDNLRRVGKADVAERMMSDGVTSTITAVARGLNDMFARTVEGYDARAGFDAEVIIYPQSEVDIRVRLEAFPRSFPAYRGSDTYASDLVVEGTLEPLSFAGRRTTPQELYSVMVQADAYGKGDIAFMRLRHRYEERTGYFFVSEARTIIYTLQHAFRAIHASQSDERIHGIVLDQFTRQDTGAAVETLVFQET